MTNNILTLINGGRDNIERDMVEALVDGDIGKLDKLTAQLEAIESRPKANLKLVS
jgi:hypothetical protein